MLITAKPSPHKRAKKPDKKRIYPTDADILCGRGRIHFSHAGNVRFRRIVAEHYNSYNQAEKKGGKTAIVDKALKDIRGRGMRFLKFNKDSKSWEIASSQKICREKVAHALRDTRDGKNKTIARYVSSSPQFFQRQDEKSQETSDGTNSVLTSSRKRQSLSTLPDSSSSGSAEMMKTREEDGERLHKPSNKKKPIKKRKVLPTLRPNPPRSKQKEVSLNNKRPAAVTDNGSRKSDSRKKRRTSSMSPVCSSSSPEIESFPAVPPIMISGRQNQEEQKAVLGNLQFLVCKLKDAQKADREVDMAVEARNTPTPEKNHSAVESLTNVSQIQHMVSPTRSEDESSFGSACLDDLNELSSKELADFLLQCPIIGNYEGDH